MKVKSSKYWALNKLCLEVRNKTRLGMGQIPAIRLFSQEWILLLLLHLILFPETGSYCVALYTALQTRLALNSERSACFCLLRAGIKGEHPQHPDAVCAFKLWAISVSLSPWQALAKSETRQWKDSLYTGFLWGFYFYFLPLNRGEDFPFLNACWWTCRWPWQDLLAAFLLISVLAFNLVANLYKPHHVL